MHAQGLVARARDDANRRVQVVTLTEAGEAAFLRLREAAIAFDARLRAGFAEPDLAALAAGLDRLAANVGTEIPPSPLAPTPKNPSDTPPDQRHLTSAYATVATRLPTPRRSPASITV